MVKDIFIKLEKHPEGISSKRVFEWADYIELFCLISPDRRQSKGDISKRLSQKLAQDSGKDPEYYADKISTAQSDWFDHLNYRLGEFGNNYPFEISDDNDTLIRKSDLNESNYLYAFLLLASSLQHIDKSYRAEITTRFEYVCCQALEICIPKWGEVRVFGSNKYKGSYPNLLVEKADQLADEISEGMHDNLVPRVIDDGETGDNGLDIVAWLPFEDNGNGTSTIFGQCACGGDDEWVKKQHDITLAAWDKIIEFTSSPYPYIFIPYCFRKSTGAWNNDRKIRHSVLVDRVRLVELLGKKEEEIQYIPMEFLTKALEFSEGLY